MARPQTAVPDDRLGNKRDEAPDAGCYELIKSENDKTEEMNNTSHKNKWPYKKIKQPNKK